MNKSLDISSLKVVLSEWLEEMTVGLPPGRFRFSSSGSLVPTEGHVAHFVTCFAMKAAWQAGIWEEWTEERRSACTEFVQSFQRPDGWFFDPWLRQATQLTLKELAKGIIKTVRGNQSLDVLLQRQQMNLRAETRQSAGALLMVGQMPKYLLPFPWQNVEGALRFINELNWKFPWAAGSHLSHLVFFLNAGISAVASQKEIEDIKDAVLSFLDQIRDPETGTWYRGNIFPSEKINGAMKVLTALEWIGRPFPDCRKLVDFALSQDFIEDGCGFLNRLLVVYSGLKGCPSGYRAEDIARLGQEGLEKVATFRKDDGGFSFYRERAQTSYYGARISNGAPVSDMHGLAMMVWAIAVCAELSGGKIPELRGWRVHKA